MSDECEIEFEDIALDPYGTFAEIADKKAALKKAKKSKKKVQIKEEVFVLVKPVAKEPNWDDLYFLLADAADHILQSVMNREDIPVDAKHLLQGVLHLRESRQMIYCEKTSLTAHSALFWSDRLKEWSTQLAPTSSVVKKQVASEDRNQHEGLSCDQT